MAKKHILITGATQGIGRACAERFARAGWQITAVARTAEHLEGMHRTWRTEYPSSLLIPHRADLSTVAGVQSVPQNSYDVLLLNAAAFAPGRLLDQEGIYEQLFSLNVLGNERLARRLLPDMLDRGRGQLLVIGSTGTDNWKGHMTAYVATKYALRGLFIGWQQDLENTGVSCCLLAPGATLTASWANETPPPDILDPAVVAELVWRAVREGWTGRHTITPGEES